MGLQHRPNAACHTCAHARAAFARAALGLVGDGDRDHPDRGRRPRLHLPRPEPKADPRARTVRRRLSVGIRHFDRGRGPFDPVVVRTRACKCSPRRRHLRTGYWRRCRDDLVRTPFACERPSFRDGGIPRLSLVRSRAHRVVGGRARAASLQAQLVHRPFDVRCRVVRGRRRDHLEPRGRQHLRVRDAPRRDMAHRPLLHRVGGVFARHSCRSPCSSPPFRDTTRRWWRRWPSPPSPS